MTTVLDGSTDQTYELSAPPTASTDGKVLKLQGADATGPGDHKGGDVVIAPGVGSGTGASGRAVIAGVVLEDQPAYGSPVVCNEDTDGWMSFTSDGVGPFYAGTGISVKQESGAPGTSQVVITCNDTPQIQVMPGVIHPSSDGSLNPYIDLGANDPGLVPFRRIFGQIFATRLGAALASAATIAPDSAIHHVTGTTAISTMTPPFTAFVGAVTLILDANCAFATGGNIDPAAVEAANLAGVAAAAVSGKAKVTLTYDGSAWY